MKLTVITLILLLALPFVAAQEKTTICTTGSEVGIGGFFYSLEEEYFVDSGKYTVYDRSSDFMAIRQKEIDACNNGWIRPEDCTWINNPLPPCTYSESSRQDPSNPDVSIIEVKDTASGDVIFSKSIDKTTIDENGNNNGWIDFEDIKKINDQKIIDLEKAIKDYESNKIPEFGITIAVAVVVIAASMIVAFRIKKN